MAAFFQQGHLEGSCGFYSVLNAVTEVNDMGWEAAHESFMRFVQDNRALAAKTYIDGLHFSELTQVVPKIIAAMPRDLQVNYSLPFAKTKFASVDAYAGALRAVIGPELRASAIVSFGIPWRHWTVATKVTDKAIALKDSTQFERKMLSSLSLASIDEAYTGKKTTIIHSRQTVLFN